MVAISAFNADINQRIVYAPEPDSGDAWQTPAQTLTILHGDCEDYAILKYSTLLQAGLSAASLRIVIGEIISGAGNQPHAWCAGHRGHLACTGQQVPTNYCDRRLSQLAS